MKSTMRRIIPALLLIATTGLQAAHITDKLLVGFYEKPDESTQPERVLSSGTPLEVLKREGPFTQVRLSDRSVGWIKTDYVTNDKPAKAIVLELQAKTGDLQQQLKKKDQELKALRATASSDGKDVAQLEQELKKSKQQLAEANKKIDELGAADKPDDSKIAELEKELDTTSKALEESKTESMLLRDQLKMLSGEVVAGQAGETRITELETELATAAKALEDAQQSSSSREPELLRLQEANQALQKTNQALQQRINEAATLLGSVEEITVPEQESEESLSWWYLLLPLLAVIGFVAGVAFKDYLVRRRYGGFRI
jgi:SH3 domain protein